MSHPLHGLLRIKSLNSPFLCYFFKTILYVIFLLGVAISEKGNSTIFGYISIIHCVLAFLLLFLTQKKPILISLCSLYLATATVMMASEFYLFKQEIEEYLGRNAMILITMIIINEKYIRFKLQIFFVAMMFVYLEARNFSLDGMYFASSFMVLMTFLLFIYQSWMAESNRVIDKKLAQENQEFMMLYQSIIKNYPTALLSFEKGEEISRWGSFKLTFANETAKNELKVDDSAKLQYLLEDIKVCTHNLFNLDGDFPDFVSEQNFLQNQLLDFSPNHRKSEKIQISENVIKTSECNDRNPQIKEFFITYAKKREYNGKKTKEIEESDFEGYCEKNLDEIPRKYRICLIRFYHKDRLTFLLNMVDLHLEEEVTQLRELDKTKDEMLASITHDLRTPLASMLKCIEFAHEAQDLSEKNQNLDLATSSGTMLMSLISDILDYSLMKKGRFKLNSSYFQLEKLLDETLSMMKVQATLKNIGLFINNVCRPSTVLFSDFLRIKQVLVNLIGNSLKFTKSGGQISLEIGHTSDPNILVFSVTDNGVGIKSELMQKLGKPFQSYDYDGRYNKQGIGLGLHICTRIVSQLGPEKQLHIESVYEKGAKFSFLIYANCSFRSEVMIDKLRPRTVSSGDSSHGMKDADPISEHSSHKNIPYFYRNNSDTKPKAPFEFIRRPLLLPFAPTSNIIRPSPLNQVSHDDPEENRLLRNNISKGLLRLRSDPWQLTNANLDQRDSIGEDPCYLEILLADDDVFTIMLMKKMIMKYTVEHPMVHIEIEVAYNGEEAIAHFSRHKTVFDLVLLDCFMPIKDGFAAGVEIRRLANEKGQSNNCAIYGCSALGDWDKEGKGIMDGHLVKPVDISRVFELIGQAVLKKRSLFKV